MDSSFDDDQAVKLQFSYFHFNFRSFLCTTCDVSMLIVQHIWPNKAKKTLCSAITLKSRRHDLTLIE